MKLTRRELNNLIENYLIEDEALINERLRKAVRASVNIPRCDFKLDPDFLEIIDFIKAGGKTPRRSIDPDADKPDIFNPVFLSAITDQLLPFMNLFVMPQVGISAKCNALRRMQALFNDTYREFSSGFETQTRTRGAGGGDGAGANQAKIAAEISELYDKFFEQMPNILRRSKVRISPERNSTYLDPGAKLPSGISRNELYYASLILGDLTKLNENNAQVKNIIRDFKDGTARNDSDLFKLASYSKDIPGYDEMGLKALFRAAVGAFGRDAAQGANNIVKITNKLFNNLVSAGIL